MFRKLLICALAWIPAPGLLIAGACFAGMTVHAQYPSKPIKIVVPYPPGGFNDTLGRTLAAKFTETWGQPSFVENKPGGNTLIGTDFVAKSPPDGYTLLVVAFPFAVTPSLTKRLCFREQVEWAERAGSLEAVMAFMQSMAEEEWLHMGED